MSELSVIDSQNKSAELQYAYVATPAVDVIVVRYTNLISAYNWL